jgi:ribosomal protein S18 acetylase RimI-like enzyme
MIREATKKDLSTVLSFYIKILKHTKKYDKNVSLKDKDAIRDDIVYELKKRNHIVLIALEDKQPIGCICVSVHKGYGWNIHKKYAYINWTYVDKNHRRKNIANQLTEQSLKLAKEKGATTCFAGVDLGNDDGFNFWPKIGFKKHNIEFEREIK